MESSEGSPGSDAIYHSVQPFPQTFQSRCLEIWYHTYGSNIGALRVYNSDSLDATQRWNQLFQTPSILLLSHLLK